MRRRRRTTRTTAALVLAAGLAVAGALPANAAESGADDAADTVAVPFVATTTALEVRTRSLVARIADQTSEAATPPSGEMVFSVDGEEVATVAVDGAVVRTPTRVAAGGTREITATYSGDEERFGSADTYTRTDPTAEVEADGTGRNGWFRSAVVVTTTCEAGSAAITSCTPERVVQQSTPGRDLVGVARAADGGRGEDTVTIRVDLLKPTLAVTGGGPGPFPRDARPLGCRAEDDMSGIDGRCRVQYGEVRQGGNGPVRPYRVSVKDVAGNARVRTGTLRIAR